MTKLDLTLPDWQPLERALPDAWLDGWMFMFFDTPPDDGELLRSYKHSITRCYLHLRVEQGGVAAYRHLGGGRYLPAKLVEEVEAAYAAIEQLGFTREMEPLEAGSAAVDEP
jgi:hypothetical protein